MEFAGIIKETDNLNKEMYIDILRRLRDAVRGKRLEKWRQCSSTPVGFGQGFLSKEQRDNTKPSPFFLYTAPPDFYLFPRLKSALQGRRFSEATEIIENATVELKRLS
jgi:hypothetical protein